MLRSLALLLTLNFLMHSQAYALIGGKPHAQLNGMIQILYATGSTCSASKVNDNVILTAAHCLFGREFTQVKIKTDNEKESLRLDVEYVHIHPAYKKQRSETQREVNFVASDMAVIVVKPDAEFSLIPNLVVDFSPVKLGQDVEVFGFGCEESANQTSAVVRKKSGSTTITSSDTLKNYMGLQNMDYKSLRFKINEVNFVSFGRKFADSFVSLCPGDSGGPVTRRGKIVGVNSNYIFDDYSPETGKTVSGVSYVNLHARLSHVRQWLEPFLRN